MRIEPRRIVSRASITLLSIAILIFAWAGFSRMFGSPDLVPSPWQTFAVGREMLLNGTLMTHVAISLERVLVGYIAGCIAGIVIGALMGRIPLIGRLADPMLQLVRPISPVALVPLSIIWFGIGDLS